MNVTGRVAIVTGGAGGIGGALAARLAAEDARVLVADIDAAAASEVAAAINRTHPGHAVAAGGDVSAHDCIRDLIARAEAAFGPVELYFANAGITGRGGLAATEDLWDQAIEVNVRAHVRAAQLLLPGWVERGEGYFVSTASAAGLLTQIGSPVYSVTKHAAVAFAEWLSVTYGDAGIRVSCLCPMGVNTKLLHAGEESGDPLGIAATRAVTSAGDVLEPDVVAGIVLEAMADERFLILPHERVLEMYRQKASDYDRWLRGMRRYQARLLAGE
ncbi:MAG TPA: SDR family oxidoreductase [Actinophytocola sp.]|uniref:SDR family oxidoreductase n=1 Tax=Actinophytocola sp. TaxID=1872138 RepID=UPI002DB5A698|nr:SDR family oxidoreductase [Actinophytocola sp.]HEU5473523.1 SDR family oxidoreductase [Actinophytocola sp.]